MREKIIKSDQLISFIKESNSKAVKVDPSSENEMRKIAEKWLSRHKENPADYTKKYYEMEEQLKAGKGDGTSVPATDATTNQTGHNDAEILCPKCGAPMIKRIAKKGTNAGKEFYGCSNFPTCRGVVNIRQ